VCVCVCVCDMCRLFFKDMQHKALEKKSNIEYLEQIGWQQFLPKFVIEGIPVRFFDTYRVNEEILHLWL